MSHANKIFRKQKIQTIQKNFNCSSGIHAPVNSSVPFLLHVGEVFIFKLLFAPKFIIKSTGIFCCFHIREKNIKKS